jgi:hypothetical protein
VLLEVSVEQLLEVLTENSLQVGLHHYPGHQVTENEVETVSEVLCPTETAGPQGENEFGRGRPGQPAAIVVNASFPRDVGALWEHGLTTG